jgi:hypothetical protein
MLLESGLATDSDDFDFMHAVLDELAAAAKRCRRVGQNQAQAKQPCEYRNFACGKAHRNIQTSKRQAGMHALTLRLW